MRGPEEGNFRCVAQTGRCPNVVGAKELSLLGDPLGDTYRTGAMSRRADARCSRSSMRSIRSQAFSMLLAEERASELSSCARMDCTTATMFSTMQGVGVIALRDTLCVRRLLCNASRRTG